MRVLRTFLLLALLLVSRASYAQEADTLSAEVPPLSPADTVTAPLDSTALPAMPDSARIALLSRPPIPFLDQVIGSTLGDSLPVRHFALDPQQMLAESQGSFVYDFGTSGWPDGWSPYGLSPNSTSLAFNRIPFNDPSSGLPSYDLLPFTMLQLLGIQPGRMGSPIGVDAQLRSYDSPRPLTDIRYRSSNNGLSSILVSHSQKRRLNLFNIPSSLHILLAYGGHGANGEYDGSKLEKARQLIARLRIQNALGSIEVMDISNRRRIGAHAGVFPAIGTNFIDIYNRFNAQVENPDAQRQKSRNDFKVTLRTPVLGHTKPPLTASTYWTSNTLRYINSDTLQARTKTFGYSLSQQFDFSTGHATVLLEGWTDRVREDSRDLASSASALPDSLGIKQSEFHLSINSAVEIGSARISLTPGYHKDEHSSLLGGQLNASYQTGPLLFFIGLARTLNPVPLVAEYGWGQTVIPLDSAPSPTTTLLKAGLEFSWNALDFSIFGFTNETTDAFDYIYDLQQDTLLVAAFTEPVSWRGLSIDLGLRRKSSKGFYFSASSTLFESSTSPDHSYFTSISQSLPELYTQGRLGMRYRIFQGDLDFDLYTRGRLWSPFIGRTLHPQTGLLVLRDDLAREIDASATLDVILEAEVRTAKFFLGFENLLSGTTIIIGNLIVPDYPLPQQRFTFGVHWPIWN